MDKNDILLMLEQIEQKYSSVPEEQRQYGSKLSPEQSENYNYETHPGAYHEIQRKVLRTIKNNPSLMNDLDIGMKIVKLAPYAFGYIGEEARENVAIFMEACKGDISGSFRAAGDNILENEEFMMMAMKIDPSLYTYMNDDMKARPEILKTYVEKAGYIPAEVADKITPELREQLTPYITYKIEGMREETYMGQVCEGHNCDFEYYTTELPRHVICCSRGDEKFEIELYTTYGECPSGWTTASWGNMDIHRVEDFGEITHLPKEPISFELQMEEDGFGCHAFGVDYIGNDEYYPMGGVGVNLELFMDKEQQQVKAIREQFEDALIQDDVVEYFKSKSPEELTEMLGPEVARMVGFEQKNSHHMYDLWEHTLHTVESVSPEGLTPEQFKKLRIAAFFHDIGKPEVSSFNPKTGQQVFYGHAHHSVDVAKPILEKLGYSKENIQQIGFFIGHHDDFISYKSTLAPFMKNHEFIRGIDVNTIAEKIIENKFDFEAMGYNKDEIRTIVYTLAHGKDPDFRTKDGPVSFPVDMKQVRKKMNSGEYDVEYDATLEDYQMLLQLCKADARAQSEIAERILPNGKKVIDGSRAEKLENMDNIESGIEEAYRDATLATEYTVSQFIHNYSPKGDVRETVSLKDGNGLDITDYADPEDPSSTIYDMTIVSPEYDENGEQEVIGTGVGLPLEKVEEEIRSHGGFDKKHVQSIIREYRAKAFNSFVIQTKNGFKRPVLVMGDGTKMSVQASSFHYCEPRKDGLNRYASYEVGYPSEIIEQLRDYAETHLENDEDILNSVFPFVPEEVILDILEEHGGIDIETTLHPTRKLDGLKQEKDGMEAKVQKAQDLINQIMKQYGMILGEDGPDFK